MHDVLMLSNDIIGHVTFVCGFIRGNCVVVHGMHSMIFNQSVFTYFT